MTPLEVVAKAKNLPTLLELMISLEVGRPPCWKKWVPTPIMDDDKLTPTWMSQEVSKWLVSGL